MASRQAVSSGRVGLNRVIVMSVSCLLDERVCHRYRGSTDTLAVADGLRVVA